MPQPYGRANEDGNGERDPQREPDQRCGAAHLHAFVSEKDGWFRVQARESLPWARALDGIELALDAIGIRRFLPRALLHVRLRQRQLLVAAQDDQGLLRLITGGHVVA